MIRLPNFRFHSKSKPFGNQHIIDHYKSGRLRILDPRCMIKLTSGTIYFIFKATQPDNTVLRPIQSISDLKYFACSLFQDGNKTNS